VGYLLCQTEIRNARAEAEAFARRLPWLTTGQHDELVRIYTEDRTELSRRLLQRIADRCHELQTEYTVRYQQLRRRLLGACVALLLGAFAVCVCTLIVTGAG
jgi:hypothetical protein